MDGQDRTNGRLQDTFVIIPMLNEQDSIGLVLKDIPRVRQVVVVDNGSTDKSAEEARAAGAHVLSEPRRGYGQACLSGIRHVSTLVESMSPEKATKALVVFLDGDYSDHPDELVDLIGPIVDDGYDFVVGSRSLGARESGAMHFQAIFGNWLACTLMRIFWGAKFSDLGPFRAIRFHSLQSLQMQDTNFGWTIEMQIKAVTRGLRYCEVPVSYRRRIGVSKISGTVAGTFKAGYKILSTIFRFRLMGR